MTDCPNAELRDQLPLLAAGRLDPAAHETLVAHLAGCAACRAELALLERVRAVTMRPPAVDTARVSAAVRAAGAGRAARRGRGGWRRWRLPAMAAAAALLALLVRDGRPGDPAGDPGAATAAVGSTATGTDSGAAGSSAADAVGLTFGGGLADLTDTELEALATSIAEIDPLPGEEPHSLVPEIPFEPEETT